MTEKKQEEGLKMWLKSILSIKIQVILWENKESNNVDISVQMYVFSQILSEMEGWYQYFWNHAFVLYSPRIFTSMYDTCTDLAN